MKKVTKQKPIVIDMKAFEAELMAEVARINQLDEMAKGCRAHAREIRQYISARGREAA